MNTTDPTLIMFREKRHSHTKKSTVIVPTEKLYCYPKQIPDMLHFNSLPSKITNNFLPILFLAKSLKDKNVFLY